MFLKKLFLVLVLTNTVGAQEKFEGVVRPVPTHHFKGVSSIDWPVTVIHFAVGDRVEKGDVLLEFDPAIKTVQIAEAKMSVAEKELLVLEAELPTYQSILDRSWRIQNENPGAMSLEELEVEDQTLSSHKAKIEVAKARVKEADLAIYMARYNYDNYQKMICPISGEVVVVSCALGMVARAEKEQLVWIEVIDASVIDVHLSVPWQEAEKIRVGENKQVSVKQGECVLPGVIIAVPRMANDSGMIPVIVRVNNPELKMIPGVKVWVTISK